MLIQKLNDEELALLEITQDPIWFGEFMRSTSDGETDPKLYPPEPWKYRDYQKQFLSDENEFILYTGGRAIGKCQPSGSRVYTTKGYKKISQLIDEPSFIVYALDPNTLELVQRRAIARHDKLSSAYTIETESGNTLIATPMHPILTPNGYKLMDDIEVGDYVAIATHLPHESTNKSLAWHELRILGYIFLLPKYTIINNIKPRFKKIGLELEIIADRLLTIWHKDFDGNYKFIQKPGPFMHPLKSLIIQTDMPMATTRLDPRYIPDILKQECLDNIAIFIEAVFAQFAELSSTEIKLTLPYKQLSLDFQELLLRFGIESRIVTKEETFELTLLDYRAIYRFWKTFSLPGVDVGNLPLPPATEDVNIFMRYDKVINKYLSHKVTDTYAIHVYEHNNYISENVFVHNSVVLEDKIIHDIVNSPDKFPVTPEMLLVTSNQAQMTPLQNRLILRFNASKFLKDFLRGNINRSTGVLTFPRKGKPFIFTMRIAGSKGENNMIGLHVPKIIGDEAQVFPLNAYTQLMPSFNSWEPNRQQIWCGVPNGIRNSVLYLVDKQTPKYKKYRIPAPNNLYYTYENYTDDLRRYGGEQDDRFQNLVLGRHGAAAFQVIPRESITTETFPFYNQRYNSSHVFKGQKYTDILTHPSLPDGLKRIILAIDPGFVDPTVIQVLGRDAKGTWRTYVRYRLTRIDFNEQQKIIDWLATFYRADNIALDIGAGGNGSAMMHNLTYGDQYKTKNYAQKIIPIQFSEHILSGYGDEGEELFQDAKSYSATELARFIQEKRLVFSELDNEGLSQMERIAKKKGFSGKDTYFVLSDKGNGVDEDDHIFASYICFIMAAREEPTNPYIRKLGKPRGLMSK